MLKWQDVRHLVFAFSAAKLTRGAPGIHPDHKRCSDTQLNARLLWHRNNRVTFTCGPPVEISRSSRLKSMYSVRGTKLNCIQVPGNCRCELETIEVLQLPRRLQRGIADSVRRWSR
jgi:hypothetical protein